MISPDISLGAEFNYSIPNDYIDCRFIRVHLKDIAFPTDLQFKQSGLKIFEIIGNKLQDNQPSCIIL